MSAPFFFRKKFLTYFGLLVLVLLLIGIAWTTANYFKAEEEGRVRWEYITVPLSLPIFALAGYVLLLPLWFVHKAKQFRDRSVSRIPELFSPPPVTLPEGEQQYGEPDQLGYTPPGGRPLLGELRFTDQRILFTKTIDVRRFGEVYGMQAPDLSISIPLNQIRQCGFGLNEKRPTYFTVIENNGNEHLFGPVAKLNVAVAMKELGWTRTQVNEHVYWIR